MADLEVDEFGAGPVVVFVHGVPSLPADFAPFAERLEPTHRSIVVHLPGYGRTPAEAEPTSVLEMSQRIERRLAQLGISEAAVVAFSGGAPKAVEIALRGFLRVTRMLLLAPVVGLDPDVAQGYRELVAQLRTGAFDPRPTWLARMTCAGIAERSPSAAARVLQWLDDVPPATICSELLAMSEMRDLRPLLPGLHCPLLVLSGAEDQAVPLTWSAEVAAKAQHGRLQLIEGAGHALFVEQPERVARLACEFLTDSN